MSAELSFVAWSGSDVAGYVLAGGQSSRMGRDKALLTFAGQSLAGRAISILTAAGLQASLAGASQSLASLAPVIQDADQGQGPLAGICAALSSTPARWAVFLSVDLPFLPASLITTLVHHVQITGGLVTLPSINGFSQTFPVVLSRDLLPALSAELSSGRRGCYSAFQSAVASTGQTVTVLPVELMVQAGQIIHPQGVPPFRWFLNLNTQSDVRHAQNIARALDIASQAFSPESRIA